MTIRDDIFWFKQNFSSDLAGSLAGSPISFDLVAALAFQESGDVWSKLRLTMAKEEVLRLCVGDTIDAPQRKAFPKDKSSLISAPQGLDMFNLAHELLVEMGDATGIDVYQHLGKSPDRFVHAFGIFQYDLQVFKKDTNFFLNQGWKNIADCVKRMMSELLEAVNNLGLNSARSLTDEQSCFVAIIYNTGFGNFDESLGLRQGHFDGKLFYGENIDRFLKIAHDVPASASGGAAPVVLAEVVAGPAVAAPGVPSIVTIATAEFDRFGGINEGSEPLRSRIADYYEAGGGSRDLDPTLDENAWSAAFVSFCVKKFGATAAQFAFNLSHSVYVKAAIANNDGDTGVFRGHPIADYAPKLGDIIHQNRGGGSITFEFARQHSGYPSHAAIVVGFDTTGGVERAITIGGNEFLQGGTGTVGKTFFPLDGEGLLDQSKIGPKLICVIEDRLAAGVDLPQALGPYVVSVRTDLKLRGGPSAAFPIIKSLANGTKLNVLQFLDNESGRWALVDLEGDGTKDGFVFAQFISPATA